MDELLNPGPPVELLRDRTVPLKRPYRIVGRGGVGAACHSRRAGGTGAACSYRGLGSHPPLHRIWSLPMATAACSQAFAVQRARLTRRKRC